MKDIVLVTDSGCDLPCNCENVEVLPFYIQREGEEMVYPDDKTLSHRKLMDYINLNVKCNIHKPTVKQLEHIIEMFDMDKFYFYFPSTVMSDMDDRYLEAYNNVFINVHNTATYNTRLTGPALGLLLEDLQRKIDLGSDVEDLMIYLNNAVRNYHLLMMPNIDYMGYSKVAGIKIPKLYNFFGVSPLLTLNDDGNLVVTRTYRHLSNVIDRYIKTIKNYKTEEDVIISTSDIIKLDIDKTMEPIIKATKTKPRLVQMTSTNAAIYGPKVLSLAYKEI